MDWWFWWAQCNWYRSVHPVEETPGKAVKRSWVLVINFLCWCELCGKNNVLVFATRETENDVRLTLCLNWSSLGKREERKEEGKSSQLLNPGNALSRTSYFWQMVWIAPTSPTITEQGCFVWNRNSRQVDFHKVKNDNLETQMYSRVSTTNWSIYVVCGVAITVLSTEMRLVLAFPMDSAKWWIVTSTTNNWAHATLESADFETWNWINNLQ